ncbi:hypothetical protein L3X38_037145 [Prunus dulcis]|uniref:Uncharacterized protein n=1 Tax=Prunus dulcis TaxID=3755 RepID=A0AAD4YR07_PRUDU|nr:hypothetical protein L3X38_037145 [Prunus dulcis]
MSGSFNSTLMKVGLGSSSVPEFFSCKGSSTSSKESSSAAGAKSSTSSSKLSSYSSVLSWVNSAILMAGFCIKSLLSSQYINNLFIMDQIVAARSFSC